MEILGQSLGESHDHHSNPGHYDGSSDSEGERFVADCMRQVITSHFIVLVCVLLLIIARCTYYCIRDRKYVC